MNTEQKKSEIIKAYGGGKQWAFRVSKMSESQVTAMYLRLKMSGRIK